MMMPLDEKRDYVKRFFRDTGETYDTIVRLGTCGIDGVWKRRMLQELGEPRRILDLACGTGILTLAIARRFPDADVVGVDITAGYLDVARRKAARLGLTRVRFEHGWAEDVAADRPFDAITSSYLAKYADLPRLVPRLLPLLAPRGRMLFHDFSYPHHRVLAAMWERYMVLLRIVLGRRYPEWNEVLIELPDLIRRTTWVADAAAALTAAGLEVQTEVLMLQGATLVHARRPES